MCRGIVEAEFDLIPARVIFQGQQDPMESSRTTTRQFLSVSTLKPSNLCGCWPTVVSLLEALMTWPEMEVASSTSTQSIFQLVS